MEPGEKPANRRHLDVGRTQFVDVRLPDLSDELQELREIALVSRDGVAGRVAIEEEVLQEIVEDVLHAPLAPCPAPLGATASVSHSARSFRARSEIASFRFCLSRIPSGGASMIPKVMFVG